MSYDKTKMKQKAVYLPIKYAKLLEQLSWEWDISESKIMAKWVIKELEGHHI